MIVLDNPTAETRRQAEPSRRARVLAISSELPWPLNTGGHIRTFHLLRALAREFHVRLLTVIEPGEAAAVERLRHEGINVRTAVVGPRRPWQEVPRVIGAALRREPYVLYRRHNRAALRRLVRQELSWQTPDVVHLDHLDPFVFRSLFPGVPLIADMHNVYSRLAERVADEHRGLKGFYLKREAGLLARVEQRVSRAADVVLTVSAEEQTAFRHFGGRDVRLVPNGVDCSAYEHLPVGRKLKPEAPAKSCAESGFACASGFNSPAPSHELLYLGAMSWQPNAKAAEFLAREVLPAVRRRFPETRLQLVGRNPGASVLALRELPGVEVAANVPDVGVYLERATLLAVPLDSGGGTRLKILEAFAAGLPVVSTPIGCEGIDATHGEHLWIAERDRFADAICELLARPEVSHQMAANARELAWSKYDWSSIGQAACSAVRAVTGGTQ